MIDIESSGTRTLPVELATREDPTGAAPAFQLTTGRRGNPSATPGDWEAGEWTTAWNAADGRIDAATPTIGEAGDLVVEAGEMYDLWARYTLPSGAQPEDRVGTIRVL